MSVPYIDFLPDNADEVLSEIPAMALPCRECPYTPGTSASQHPVTTRLAKECAESRCAFFCHMTADLSGDATHLCAGWVSAIGQQIIPVEGQSR